MPILRTISIDSYEIVKTRVFLVVFHQRFYQSCFPSTIGAGTLTKRESIRHKRYITQSLLVRYVSKFHMTRMLIYTLLYIQSAMNV